MEDLCADLRDFARQSNAKKVSVSDSLVYGAGMDAMIAVAKMRGLSDYARRELGVELFIHNGEPPIREVPVPEKRSKRRRERA